MKDTNIMDGNKKVFRHILFFVFLALILAGSGNTLSASERRLTILHTNDLHSHFLGSCPNRDYSPLVTNNDKTTGGWARIASLIKSVKAARNNPVLVLDAGDFLMGSLFHMVSRQEALELVLMKEMGLKAYRFSISWPRILPAGRGEVNQAGINFYSQLVDALLEEGIEPCVTLYHWDLPQALQDEGGWPARMIVDAFVDYADVVSRALGDRVKNWITFNEPFVSAIVGYLEGRHAPGHTDLQEALAASHH